MTNYNSKSTKEEIVLPTTICASHGPPAAKHSHKTFHQMGYERPPPKVIGRSSHFRPY